MSTMPDWKVQQVIELLKRWEYSIKDIARETALQECQVYRINNKFKVRAKRRGSK